jgi:hypothetical protein
VEDAVGTRPKYGAQVGFLVAAQSCDERAHCFFGGYEAALRLRRVRGCRLRNSNREDRCQDLSQPALRQSHQNLLMLPTATSAAVREIDAAPTASERSLQSE